MMDLDNQVCDSHLDLGQKFSEEFILFYVKWHSNNMKVFYDFCICLKPLDYS